MLELKDYRDKVLRVKDKITGLTGIVTGHADYITGCDQYLVQPPVESKKNGDFKDARWIDEGRLEIVTVVKGITVHDVQGKDDGADVAAPVK